MRVPKAVLGGFLVVVLLGAGIYLLILNKGPSAPENQVKIASSVIPGEGTAQAPGQRTEAAPLPVKVAKAFKGDLVMTLKSPGEAYTEKRISMRAEVGGVVKNLYAAEGRHVKEGDLLVELDDREYRLRLEKLEAQRIRILSELVLEKEFETRDAASPPQPGERFKKAQADFERASEAFQKGLISQAAYEQAQKDYELAMIEVGLKKEEIMASTKGLTQIEIDVKIARMDLEKTRIRAPFAGILTDIKLSPKERIEAGRELFILVDISRLKIRAKVLESEVGKIRTGREVDLLFSAFPGRAFKGRIEAVSPVISSEDRTCAVHITMDNPSEEAKPGMHAEVEFPTEIFHDRLLVPQKAILVRGGRKLVFAVENGVAKWRYIEVGLENDRFAEVLPGREPGWGVNEGDDVIIKGHVTLAHDTRVAIIE